MTITTFNPMILSKEADSIIKLLEEMGFEKKRNSGGVYEWRGFRIRGGASAL